MLLENPKASLYEKNETKSTVPGQKIPSPPLCSSHPLARKWRLETKVNVVPCDRAPGGLRRMRALNLGLGCPSEDSLG